MLLVSALQKINRMEVLVYELTYQVSALLTAPSNVTSPRGIAVICLHDIHTCPCLSAGMTPHAH